LPVIDQIRAEKLLASARERFDPTLKDAEEKLLRDSARAVSDRPGPDEPRQSVRSELVRWLLTDREAAEFIDARGVWVSSVTFNTKLDLSYCSIGFPLYFVNCEFADELEFKYSDLHSLLFYQSKMHSGMVAWGMTARGIVRFDGCESPQLIDLISAQIEGNLECGDGTKLTGEGVALMLSGATIDGGVFLQRLECAGQIFMINTEIGGNFECTGAKMTAKKDVLYLNGSHVQGSVFFDDHFSCSGRLILNNTKIEGVLRCRDATIHALQGEGMQVGSALDWTGIQNADKARLVLKDARTKNLHDERESWPAAGNLSVNNFVYEELTLHPPRSEEEKKDWKRSGGLPLIVWQRIEWLNRQGEKERTEPQPWMHLAKLLEGKGDKKGAKRVTFELRRHQALAQWKKNRLMQFAAIQFARLEEQPMRILVPIALFVMVGWAVFWLASAKGTMAPTNRDVYKAWAEGKPYEVAYPRFNPLVYSVENLLPIGKLGQDDKWAPDAGLAGGWYVVLVSIRLILILAGWGQASVLAAAVSGRFRS
jgi:hypothetical protein